MWGCYFAGGAPDVGTHLKDTINRIKERLARLNLPQGVVLAGGILLTLLMGLPTSGSDYDLFLISDGDPEEEVRRVRAQLSTMGVESGGGKGSNHLSYAAPMGEVQLICRRYFSRLELMLGFDLDSSCILWDGEEIYITPRFLRAIRYGNLVDVERQSASYTHRLHKYFHTRGVAPYIPMRHLMPWSTDIHLPSTIANPQIGRAHV